MAEGGGSTDLQSSPSPGQGGVNINKQLRKAGVFVVWIITIQTHGLDYWVG